VGEGGVRKWYMAKSDFKWTINFFLTSSLFDQQHNEGGDYRTALFLALESRLYIRAESLLNLQKGS
jgi:hypothetical protein